MNLITQSSTATPRIVNKELNTALDFKYKRLKENKKYNLQFQYDIPLYKKNNTVSTKSGLNWGLSNGHVADGDAYIRIPKELLQTNPDLIPPFDDSYTSKKRKKRSSDPIEIIWDDGVTMEASLEGKQEYNNLNYPKQIASYSSQNKLLKNKERISAKSILGRYLRKRLNVTLTEPITYEILEKYGRTTITLSLIDEGIYFADFSVNK